MKFLLILSIIVPSLSFRALTFTVRPARALASSLSSSDSMAKEHAWIYSQAERVAQDDRSTPAQARRYLDELLHIQSGCATGVLDGEDICDQVTETAALVAALRVKAQEHPQQDATQALATSLAFSVLLVGTLVQQGGVSWEEGLSVVPVTLQEWKWAIEGGYLPRLMTEVLQSGGLVVDQEGLDTMAQPLQWQEIVWSIRDGYFPQLMRHFAQNGGI